MNFYSKIGYVFVMIHFLIETENRSKNDSDSDDSNESKDIQPLSNSK